MLVDDDKNILDSLSRILGNSNYEFFKCRDGLAALDLLEREKDGMDVIIADHKMPYLEGTELLMRIREEYPNVIRIMLTGYDDMKLAMKAINEGRVFKFFLKPCDISELKLAVKHALIYRDLWKENREFLKKIIQQEEIIRSLHQHFPEDHQFEEKFQEFSAQDLSLDDFYKQYFS